MKKYEYKLIKKLIPFEVAEKIANELGIEGWELIYFGYPLPIKDGRHNFLVMFFKRIYETNFTEGVHAEGESVSKGTSDNTNSIQ